MKMARLVLALVAVSMLTACGVKQSVGDAEAQISTFHADINAGRFDEIWNESSAELRKASSKDDFLNLMKAIHRKLGPVKKSQNVGWNANATTGGTFITVQMQTEFARGSGIEQFIYRKSGDDLQLNAYNINSRDLLIN